MKPKYIVLHHSATTKDVPIETIRQWHLDRGFDDVGYHYYVRKDGTVQQGRQETVKGAHCRAGGMNHKSIGICFAGDFTEEDLTLPQIKSGKLLVWSIKNRHDIKDIIGHKDADGASTLCPGFDINIIKE